VSRIEAIDTVYTLGPMRREDVDEVLAIERTTFTNPWPVESFVHEIEKNPFSYPIVARTREDRIAGYCVKWVVFEHMHIQNIAVHPQHQRRGLGRFLLEDAMSSGRRVNVATVQLEVRESNRPAQRLYESLGFRRVGTRARYYSNPREDAILYEKDLLDWERT
jgi:ribosomal-protein-alanine N-acetyltransferase